MLPSKSRRGSRQGACRPFHHAGVRRDTLRERRHRKEMQECIGTKDNEDQSEKNPGDNSENFHSSTITSWTANSNTEMVNAGSGRDQLRFFPKQFV